MGLELYSKEQLQEMSLIEIAYEILTNRKQPIAFHELLSEVAKVLELSDEEVRAKMAQFYTDLNIDGRFLALGENRWGLRTWYPVDTIEEDVVTTVKPKKKKAKKAVDEDEIDEYDEAEDDYDYDDLDDYDEEDELLDDEEDEDFDDLDEVDEFDEDEFDLDDAVLGDEFDDESDLDHHDDEDEEEDL